MTEPVKTEQPKVQTSFYAQPTAGNVNGSQGNFAKLGLALGGQIDFKDGTYAKAEISGGTYRGANLSIGHEFNIGKHMGLDLSANAQYMQNNLKSNLNIYLNNNMSVETPEQTYTSQSFANLSSSYNEGDSRINTKAMFNFEGKAGKIGVGVEAGYKTNHGVNIQGKTDAITEVKVGDTIKEERAEVNYTLNTKNAGAYVTPKLEGELNLGKHAKIVANADLKQQNVGFKWTF